MEEVSAGMLKPGDIFVPVTSVTASGAVPELIRRWSAEPFIPVRVWTGARDDFLGGGLADLKALRVTISSDGGA